MIGKRVGDRVREKSVMTRDNRTNAQFYIRLSTLFSQGLIKPMISLVFEIRDVKGPLHKNQS